MAKAALACGADGILVEVHYDPPNALSAGRQSLFPESTPNWASGIAHSSAWNGPTPKKSRT